MKTIQTAMIVDPFGTMMDDRSSEDEIEHYTKTFGALLAPHKLVVTTPPCVSDSMDADLVLFDFGGMSIGNDLMGSNSRALIRWLQDHPSSLVVVVSTFTYDHGLQPELENLGLDTPHNLLVWQHDMDDDANAKIQAWFGVKTKR